MSDFACSTLKKVEKLDFGGRGAYCCVPQCKSAFYDSQGKKSGIGLFEIPKDIARRSKWSKIIYQFRRKGANDNFIIKNTTLVYELHFKIEDIQFQQILAEKL